MIKKLINNTLILFILLLFVYRFQGELESALSQVRKKYLPCTTPVAYTLGSLDARFGLSQEEFLALISEAEKVWEEPTGKDLFIYKAEASLKVNLVYDSRQQTTLTLNDINKSIEGGQAVYDSDKAKFDSLKAEYAKARNYFEGILKTFEQKQTAYNQEVAKWNQKGGAPEGVYADLEKTRVALEAELRDINNTQQSLNQKVLDINTYSKYLNEFAQKLNLEVSKYNEIGQTHTEEFEEGVYHVGPDGEWIDIYQFENQTALRRVLAHELAHALGLDHVEDPEAIMYRLNESQNTQATPADLEALKTICKI